MSAATDDLDPLAHSIESSRSDPDRWVRRARISLTMGEFEQAREDLQHALGLDPGHVEARLELLRLDASIDRLRVEVFEQEPWSAISAHGPGQGTDEVRREFFRSHLAPTCPSVHAIEAIATWVGSQTVLEVHASKGLWSRLLADRGVEVLCSEASRRVEGPTWMHILPLSPLKAVQTLVADVLLLDAAGGVEPEAIRAFRGDALVALSEGHEATEQVLAADWSVVQTVRIPSFSRDFDRVRFLVRKSS